MSNVLCHEGHGTRAHLMDTSEHCHICCLIMTHRNANPSDDDGMIVHTSLSSTMMSVTYSYCAQQSGNTLEQIRRTVLTRFTANGTRLRRKTIPARSFFPSSSAYTRSAEKPRPRLSEWCRRGRAGKWCSHAKHRYWVRFRA